MKYLVTTSFIAVLAATPAMADTMAVIDFDGDGYISSTDYIGPKSKIVAAKGMPAQYETVTTERVVTVPGSSNAVDISSVALPADYDKSQYVHVGNYTFGPTQPLVATPASTRTVVEEKRVLVSAATPGMTDAVIYGDPHGYVEGMAPAALRGQIADIPNGADGVVTAAEMGSMDDQYSNDRLAEYDTNQDGRVTVQEAMANVDPLIDPNAAAESGSVFEATTGTARIDNRSTR